MGSTIEGGVKLASTKGLCREELWPYTGRYDTSPPVGWEKCYEDARRHVIASYSVLRSYQEVFDYLASGVGAVSIGITWSLQNAPVCEAYSGYGGGGHAVALLGYSRRKDSKGRKYLWLLNSWGTRWGNQGWCEVSPTAIEQMLRARYTVMIGMSDLQGEGVRPRQPDWLNKSPFYLGKK